MYAIQQIDTRGDTRNRVIDLSRRRRRVATSPDLTMFRIISISGADVTIGAGVAYRGGVPLSVAESAPITVASTGQWLALQITPSDTPGDDTAEIVLWTSTTTVPGDHGGYIVRGLWRFTVAGGVATATLDGRLAVGLGMMGY